MPRRMIHKGQQVGHPVIKQSANNIQRLVVGNLAAQMNFIADQRPASRPLLRCCECIPPPFVFPDAPLRPGEGERVIHGGDPLPDKFLFQFAKGQRRIEKDARPRFQLFFNGVTVHIDKARQNVATLGVDQAISRVGTIDSLACRNI